MNRYVHSMGISNNILTKSVPEKTKISSTISFKLKSMSNTPNEIGDFLFQYTMKKRPTTKQFIKWSIK